MPELAAHRFDPSDGLDMTEVAMLAVVNNPDLKAARDDAQVSRAQVFAAGLIPDPQLNLTQDIPTNNMAGLTTAFNIGLSIDTKAIITRHVRTQAAEADSQAVDLNILWQEWQVVSQARLLFVKTVYMGKVVKVFQENKSLFTERYAKSLKAFERGDTTADAMSANLVALQDADRQLYDAVQQMKQSMYGLNALMGLSPDTRLDLVESASDFTPIDSEATGKALADLPRRRPDLLALAEGYQSQEQKVRQAVLEQFPAINIGVTRARDTSGINTVGFGITMSLPVFDRNRGNIAIEEATRQKLHDQYQARLDAATGEISRLRLEQKQLREQLDAVKG
ncbi:MAG TPA: TolC family protein, partial [Nitrospirota bacterium]